MGLVLATTVGYSLAYTFPIIPEVISYLDTPIENFQYLF
jgi:hypothetical protein